MKNFKHSIVAIIAVAMISSLAVAQAASFNAEKSAQTNRINSAAATDSINVSQQNIAQKEVSQGTTAVAVTNNETVQAEVEDDIQLTELEAAKSYYQIGYVNLTSGTLNVRQEPSEEAQVTDQLEACTEVEVMESSEGWYKVSYNGGKTGYVNSGSITSDKSDAEYSAMHYDNYKKAVVNVFGSTVNVRQEASKDSAAIDELDDATPVTVLWSEGDFIRICYGDSYTEGYVINTALELTGEWIEKSTISQKQQEIAEQKAAAERAERIAREHSANLGKSTAQTAQTSSSSSEEAASEASASSSSSMGDAIVNKAKQYLGVPYVWGGTSPSGFDCSGLVQYVCNSLGISVNRVAEDQRNNGTYVSRENLQPGDLVFFANGSTIHHVGIYVGDGNMIHAPQTGDVVKISSINTEYRIAQYAGAVRVY